MSRSYFTQCPRCGTRAFENLCGYSHCIECLYSPEPTIIRDFITMKEADDIIKSFERDRYA